jgi:squalene/oxidosqualene cyclase-like protein
VVPGSPAEVLTPSERGTKIERAYEAALGHLRSVQHADGRVAGEVVWNIMLPCQYVILSHVLRREIPEDRKRRIHRSLKMQVRDDGGWGMHPDSPSWLFHTVLGYVALRLLGYDRSDPLVARSLQWIRDHGGPYELPAWGRIWLAMLGLYPWSGVQPIVPELWLLPEASPLHPWRLYCHMRLIYLGLSFVYGHQFVAPADERIDAIRRELYPEGYSTRRFRRHRERVAATDLFEAPSRGLKGAFRIMRGLSALSPASLRRRALDRAMEHIQFEFRSTGYVCLSPVNGMLFTLALFITDPHHPDLERALAGLEYWMWEDEHEGLRIAGARSDIWDTAFMIQALCEGPPLPAAKEIVRKACRWLPTAQIQEEIVDGAKHFRMPAYGGWGFANEDHPWPVSDCTAEALEALMRAEKRGWGDDVGRLQLGRKLAAIEFVLLRQNEDGGFGSYEPRRGPMLLRGYNPAEIYGNCMLEYSYTECTGSCVRGLAYAYRAMGDDIPPELRGRIRAAVDKGTRFLLDRDHEGGGWLGFWGINLTYGTFFATAGLLEGGVGTGHPKIARAARWLVKAQREDGGWGEDFQGLVQDADIRLPHGEPSLVVQTAWAVLALQAIAPHERDAIDRGIAYLVARQSPDGSWPSERATGVFFNTAVLDYRLYRQVFPTWALARALG